MNSSLQELKRRRSKWLFYKSVNGSRFTIVPPVPRCRINFAMRPVQPVWWLAPSPGRGGACDHPLEPLVF